MPTGFGVGAMESSENECRGKEGVILSSMQGMIIKVNVEVGDEVKAGDTICVIEAMKMENDIQAEADGVVEEIFVDAGDAIGIDDCLMVIK